MSDWIGQLGYFGIALLMLAKTVFPPLLSAVFMPLAGMAASRGTLSLGGVVAAGSAGATAGNVLWFAVARALGVERFRGFVERHGRWLTLDWRDIEGGPHLFEKAGGWLVCLGRLIPTVRSIVSIPAALLHMRWLPFILWSAVGTIAWTALLAGAGALLDQRFGAVDRVVGPISTGVLFVLAGIYVWRVIRWPHHQP